MIKIHPNQAKTASIVHYYKNLVHILLISTKIGTKS